MKILTAIRNLVMAWAFVLSIPAQAELAPLKTVAAVDVPRYMGTWHEIAKYPNWFQRKCASSTQATYTLQTDGRVQVLNRCKTDKGEWREALGVARQIGGPTSAKLKVRFAPEWLSFIPMVWGDYWIIDLDPQYQWVLVVVCLPLCKAFEISPVAACALGTKRLTKVLLPAPEGPKIKVVLPCNWASSSSKPAPLFSDKAKVFSPICRYGSIRCQASANAGPKSDLLTTSKGVMP